MFRHRNWKALGLGAMLSLIMPSAASAGLLGMAGEYGEFVFGSSSRSNTSSRGPVAVGGSASFSNFSIASSSSSPGASTAPNLVVGGALSWSNGSLSRGSGYIGGGKSISGLGFPGGGTIHDGVASLPISFSAEQASLAAISAAQYSATDPTVHPTYGALTFGSQADAGLHVYNVSAADLSAANTFKVAGDGSATVIINVLGNSANFHNAGISLVGGISSSHVLWNFLDASALTISGIGVNGTILAPHAAVSFNSGQINGSLIAATLAGTGATYIDQGGVDARFTGQGRSGAIPEPASLTMLGTTLLIGLGVAASRRRRARCD